MLLSVASNAQAVDSAHAVASMATVVIPVHTVGQGAIQHTGPASAPLLLLDLPPRLLDLPLLLLDLPLLQLALLPLHHLRHNAFLRTAVVEPHTMHCQEE